MKLSNVLSIVNQVEKSKFINVDVKSAKRKGASKFGNKITGNFKILRSIFLSYIFH